MNTRYTRKTCLKYAVDRKEKTSKCRKKPKKV